MLERYSQGAPPQETALLDTARRLGKLRQGRIAVHIHLSNLNASYRREHYLRIATDLFTSCVSHFEGQIFVLENKDIIFIGKNVSLRLLDDAVNRLRVLFSEDPIAQFYPPEENGRRRFCTWYELEKDYDAFLKTAEKLLRDAEKARKNPQSKAEKAYQLEAISPASLSKLNQSLSMADVSNFIQRQTVCMIYDDFQPELLFDEFFVSIDKLQEEIAPGIDILSDRWLFQYLTHTLDKRVMAAFVLDGINKERPFSLNLNIATILSPEFARFESAITPHLRGRLVIEMNKIDVFSDMGAFLFARDYLHERGFRICLDGLTHHTLPYYDRTRLGFDLIKIVWTPGSIDEMRREFLPSLRSVVMEAGQERTILCRCENKQAIEIGKSLGIVMFQGRYVERLLKQPPFSLGKR